MATGQGILAAHSDDVSTTEGGPFNGEWKGGILHTGYHKSGFARGPLLRFTNPGIPPGSTINSATIVGNVGSVSGGAGNVLTSIKLLDVDGYWDAASLAAQWTPSVGSAQDWKVELEETGPTQLAITGATDARAFGPTLEGDNGTGLQRVAQGVTIATGGNINTARVSLGGSFVPGTGNVWVEIWSNAGGLPGTLLGTSATRPISDIAPKLWAEVRPVYDFTFTGGDVVTVSAAQAVHVVMRTDVAGGGIGIHLGTSNYAYAGDLQPYGTSPDGGFDQQNYLVWNTMKNLPTTGGVAWTLSKALGLKTSPSIASLIATKIGQVGYTAASLIGLRLDVTGGVGEVHFTAYPGTAAAQFVLNLDWTPPVVTVFDAHFPKELVGGIALFALAGGLIASAIVGGLASPKAVAGGVCSPVEFSGGVGVDLAGGINGPVELGGGVDC